MVVKLGRRQSTYISYIDSIKDTRKNLQIKYFSQVSSVIFSKNKKRAIGVKYIRHGIEFKAYAYKEVIISAGTYETPLLMFRSGIGPQKMLKKAGVKIIILKVYLIN